MSKKHPHDLKSIRLTILVSPKEYQMIKEAREKDNGFDSSVSSYMRDLVLGACEAKKSMTT
jgi:hypothetical protein